MHTRRQFVRSLLAIGGFMVARCDGDRGRTGGTVPTNRRVDMEDHLNVAALVFPGMDQIDLTGPFAVLSRLPDSTVQLVWKDTDPIRDYRGLRLIPDARFADARPVDLLVVPGGPGQEEIMEDDSVLSFVRDRAGLARCVFSVCTGALVCGAAGLLRGRPATTHWGSIHLLPYFGAVPRKERVVVDGTYVSAAGLTAGIDGALRVGACKGCIGLLKPNGQSRQHAHAEKTANSRWTQSHGGSAEAPLFDAA